MVPYRATKFNPNQCRNTVPAEKQKGKKRGIQFTTFSLLAQRVQICLNSSANGKKRKIAPARNYETRGKKKRNQKKKDARSRNIWKQATLDKLIYSFYTCVIFILSHCARPEKLPFLFSLFPFSSSLQQPFRNILSRRARSSKAVAGFIFGTLIELLE